MSKNKQKVKLVISCLGNLYETGADTTKEAVQVFVNYWLDTHPHDTRLSFSFEPKPKKVYVSSSEGVSK